MKYNFNEIEKKHQRNWEEKEIFKTDIESEKNNFYVLEMFMYPSGSMHMGHLRNYTLGDVIARYKRMKGFNVLHPIGWDSFGLPAEMAAIQRGLHPEKWTKSNIEEMKRQIKRIGISYDWSREISTCEKEYYKWNQWIFKKMYEKGLAYKNKSFVNWDVDSGTVLANEQVVNGRSWRGGEVIKKELEQWFLKITDYANQLLEDHKELEGKWPERVLAMQRNWIGKSEGIEIDFEVPGNESLTAFTTRLDTVYGVTFIAISKSHPFAKKVALKNEKVDKFIKEYFEAKDEKEGIFTWHYAINPLNGERIPIWITNYVLDYGSGAVIGVPGHDERDNEFSKKYQIKIKQVITNENRDSLEFYGDKGILINSEDFDGLNYEEAIDKIYKRLEPLGSARKKVNYRLKDWLISRQRYWGTPIPVLYKDEILLEKDENLPVELPKDVEFKGEGNPLAHSNTFKKVKLEDIEAERETDTMDTFMDSSWYYLRYLDPKNNKEIFRKEIAKNWPQVDVYIGGIEHAVMHLLYSRFIHKILRDLGLVSSNEPFKRYLPQGMVLGPAYYDADKKIYYSPNELKALSSEQKEKLIVTVEKMSKSKKNGVSPEEIIDQYGADAARVFILFAAPLEKDLEWSEEGIAGSFRFLNRIWNLIIENKNKVSFDSFNLNNLNNNDKKVLKDVNIAIKRISNYMESMDSFNVAIAAIMELLNSLSDYREPDNKILGYAFKNILILLSPFAPHITEELWSILGFSTLISLEEWPSYNETLMEDDFLSLPVQVNGKLRAVLEFKKGLKNEEILEKAKDIENVKKYLEGKIEKEIYIPNKLINFVVK